MKQIRIALAINHNLGYCRRVLEGISRYSLEKPNWVFVPSRADREAVRALRGCAPDGLIAQVFDSALKRPLSTLKRPLVNISRALFGLPWPRVGTDETQVAELVADHLLNRGLSHFAVVCSPEHCGNAEREQGFHRAIGRAGYAVATYHTTVAMTTILKARPWSLDRKLRQWLLDLPKPVGIFACNDQSGVQLLEVCRLLGLRVPEDIALVGADNDDLLCRFARPALSSVAVPAEQIGYEAAALLDRLLQGKKPPQRPALLPPMGLVVRQSSDLVAIDDPEVAKALAFIRAHGHEPLRVTDVLREVALSRRALEKRFQKTIHRGLAEEIRRVHIERAKVLLAQTELPIASVAPQSGFSGNTHLCVVFQQETGATPSAYRGQFRRSSI